MFVVLKRLKGTAAGELPRNAAALLNLIIYLQGS